MQAPAGSGKTELLTDRILALLATVNRPEEIVAITFTRKAASEMHARVLSKLRRGLEPMPEPMHERRSWELAHDALARNDELGWHLLEHPARLAIRTIDSFCAGRCAACPGCPSWAACRRSPTTRARTTRPRPAPRWIWPTISRKSASCWNTWMWTCRPPRTPSPTCSASATSGCRCWPTVRTASMEEWLADAIGEDLLALSDAMPLGWAEALSGPARLAATQLQEGGEDNKLAALLDWTDELPPDAFALDAWRALAHLLLTGTGSLRKTVNKNLGFPAKCAHKEPFVAWLEGADADAPWVRRLDAARDIPDPAFTDAQWRVLGAQLMTLKLAVAQLRLRFSDTGEIDFIEIAQRAASALGHADDPGELLLKLDASIRHLLIDEFQDTSQTQLDLLNTLTSGWQEGDGRSLFGRRPDAVYLPLPQGRGAPVPAG